MFQFRLQALLERRIQEEKKAKEFLEARQKELASEQRTMRELGKIVTDIKELYQRKRFERIDVSAREGGSIRSRSDRLTALKLDLQSAEANVLLQQMFVNQAEDAVHNAEEEAGERRLNVEVLEKYRAKTEAKFLKEQAYREEQEQDEIGNVMHLSRRIKG